MPDEKHDWWIGKDGRRLGPYSITVLQRLIAQGKLTSSDLVWRDGFDVWMRADDIEGLFVPPPLPLMVSEVSGEESANPMTASENAGEEKSSADAAPEDSIVSYAPASIATSKNQSYIRRHWTGQLSLPVSYWINMYLLSALWAVSLTLWIGDGSSIDTRAEFAGLIGVLVATITITIWQVVGVWRSAENYIENGRPRFWARAAQTLCVLGVLGGAIQYMQYGETYYELAKIVLGTDDFSDFEIRILEDGNELAIFGAIGFGLADEFERTLSENPDVSVIHLNSRGGRIAEARRIREIISRSDRRLATVTSTECISACTVAFLGGYPRYLKDTARLGFHRYQFPGLSDADFEGEIATEREYMLSHGIEESFIDKATSELANDMWYPTHEELMQSGFVHEISSGQAFSNIGTSFVQMGIDDSEDLVRQFEKAWDSTDEFRIFSLLEQNHRGIKAGFIGIAKEFQQDDRSWEEFLTAAANYGRELGASYLPQYMALSQDRELLNMVRFFLTTLDTMLSQPGDACYTWMFGGGSQTYSSELDIPGLLVAMTDVVESALEDPAAPPTPSESEALIDRLLELYVAQEGMAALDDLELTDGGADTLSERRRACSATAGLYRAALQMESHEAASTMRAMFSFAE